MPRIGITGHSNLSAATVALVAAGIRVALAPYAEDLTGVTCLARGADQVFARVVLELGGTVEVVLPARDYRDRIATAANGAQHAAEFDELLTRANLVHTMPFARSGRDAYMAASEHMRATVGTLIAVWDGKPATGYGGTADVVDAARQAGIAITVVWPHGAERT